MIKIFKYNEMSNEEIFQRSISGTDVASTVSSIIADVRENKDRALKKYSLELDRVELKEIEVTDAELANALNSVDPDFIRILKLAKSNIESFHKRQLSNSFIINEGRGVILGQKVVPIERVGIYVPGGTAAYPSSVLMNAIPAKLAGCSEVVMVSPPGSDGSLNPDVLAAAHISGVDRIFKVGGAQAVAALAYGTESIPQVDKIVGPGNAYVAEAKKQVFGQVAIDMIAGPSEILIIADEASDARKIAADLLSQAEHDRLATAVMITDSMELALRVQSELELQVRELDRADIAGHSIDNYGKLIVTRDLDEAINLSNELAPEHLELFLDDPFDYLDMIKNAGSVFMGRNCPEALGDYLSGTNHTLPTLGTAKFSSPLSVDDFVKKIQYTYYSKEAIQAAARDVAAFAKREGLTAHAKSALSRLDN